VRGSYGDIGAWADGSGVGTRNLASYKLRAHRLHFYVSLEDSTIELLAMVSDHSLINFGLFAISAPERKVG
jgi:hypothetical protein